MSLTCGFFNAEDGDRQYFNSDLSNFLEGLIEDGIYAFIGDKMMVTEAVPTPDMTVNVGSGRAWFNETWTKIDTAYQVTIPASDSVQSRIDALCLTINKTRAVRDNYIEVIQGTGSVSNPTKPTVADEPNIFRHVLCYITVPAACTAITQAQIENRIGMDTALFTTPKWGDVPTTEQMVAQWQAQFDQFMDHIHETFDYDAAGNLQVGIDNLAPTYNSGSTYSEGDMALQDNVLKRKESGSFVTRKVSELLTQNNRKPDITYTMQHAGAISGEIYDMRINFDKITPFCMLVVTTDRNKYIYRCTKFEDIDYFPIIVLETQNSMVTTDSYIGFTQDCIKFNKQGSYAFSDAGYSRYANWYYENNSISIDTGYNITAYNAGTVLEFYY